MTFGGGGPHNPNSNDMHPDDRRNLIIFILIAVAIYFAFDHFVMQPQVMAMRAAQLQAQQEKTLGAVNGDQPAAAMLETRDDIVAAGTRLPIDNGAIFGTLPLTGNRIDDIQLSHYVRTLHGSDHVPVLIPAGTAHPKFAEIGWVAEDSSVLVPGKDTRWSVSA
ncbi:MAG TPA: YidC/Oxa1 family insertase periplasmic-domain containing protein, partial [Micavibrio sp.]